MFSTELFIDNKYTKYYFKIVNNASTRTLSTYTETHHIIPRSMGGTDCIDNLVDLTAREHFICHMLLMKMCKNKQHAFKMAFAANIMRNNGGKGITENRYVNNRMYEIIRKNISNAMSTRVVSEETRKKMSKAKKGQKLSEEHKAKIANTLKNRDTETKAEEYRKRAEANRGQKRTEETKRKISEGQKGKKLSEDHKRKISEFQLNCENWADWNIGLKRTEESKQKMRDAWAKRKDKSSAIKGKKTMWCIIDGEIQSKAVSPDEIETYSSNGWTLGMRPDRKRKKS